ncbi:MAG: hypothetical protein LBV29_06130 [Azoarcus sp.]|nr:hypothetical protein [Azoarcus sp.]
MIITGKGKKKKHKKARGREKGFSAQNTLIEPFIGTVQNEPASSFSTETFPPISLEGSDRIVVERSYLESSPVPTQFIRESIHPAVLGVAAAILILFLGGLLWWNFGETDHSQANVLLPTTSSESLPGAKPSLTLSTPDSSAEDAPVLLLEQERVSASEPESELMNIPSLPANQRQGRHNQHDTTEIEDPPPLSLYPNPRPMSAPSVPSFTPSQKQAAAAMPSPVETPESTATPVLDTPVRAPVVTNSHSASPPWLRQMRSDLSNCRSFFCRERVRRQYCSDPWEDIPECKGAAL